MLDSIHSERVPPRQEAGQRGHPSPLPLDPRGPSILSYGLRQNQHRQDADKLLLSRVFGHEEGTGGTSLEFLNRLHR